MNNEIGLARRVLAVTVPAVLLLAFVFAVFSSALEDAFSASKLSSPRSIRARTKITSFTKAKVTLSWTKVKGASKYGVYVSKKQGSGYKLVKYVKSASFAKRYPKSRNLFFKVRAVKGAKKSDFSIYACVRPGKSGYNATKISLDFMTTQFTEGKIREAAGSANGKIAKSLGVRFISGNTKVVSVSGRKVRKSTGETTCRLSGRRPGKAVVRMVAPNGMEVSRTVIIKAKPEPRPVVKDVAIPDLVGQNYEDAIQTLKKKLLASHGTIEVFTAERLKEEYPGMSFGQVLGQYMDEEMTEPALPGTIVKSGTCIYLLTAKKRIPEAEEEGNGETGQGEG